jgi:hypothetical protein
MPVVAKKTMAIATRRTGLAAARMAGARMKVMVVS